jgi:predicted transcriptional regulator
LIALLVVAPVNTGPNKAVPGAAQFVRKTIKKIKKNFLNIKFILLIHDSLKN